MDELFTRRAEPEGLEFNVQSLVDVAFVLLLVFMMITPMMHSGVEIDLPAAEADPLNTEQEPVVVSIDAEGQVYLGEEETPVPNIQRALGAMTGFREAPTVYVRADQKAEYGHVLHVLALIRHSGAQSVSLVSEEGGP